MPQPLFICHANCCRSVLAHYLYAHLHPDHPVLSAGIEAGFEINERAFEMLRHWGIDAGKHRPTQLTRKLCEQADGLFVMAPEILTHVLRWYGQDLASKAYLFADPYSMPESFLYKDYRVHDPSWDPDSVETLTQTFEWFHDRVRQIHATLHGQGTAPTPASQYLSLLLGRR